MIFLVWITESSIGSWLEAQRHTASRGTLQFIERFRPQTSSIFHIPLFVVHDELASCVLELGAIVHSLSDIVDENQGGNAFAYGL